MSAAIEPVRLHSEFEEDGFVFVPGFLTPAGLAELRREKARFLSEVVPAMPAREVYYEDKDDPASLKQLQQLHRHDSYFARLSEEGKPAELATTLLGEAAVLQNVQYFNKPAGRSKPTPAHQDGFYFPIEPNHAVTLWLALEDVTVRQGCVRYVMGSHRLGMRPHETSGTLGFSQRITDYGRPEDREHEIAMPCRAGDLVAHHSLTIHRCEANQDQRRSREAIGFIYYAASCGVDAVAARSYQDALAQRHRDGGRI